MESRQFRLRKIKSQIRLFIPLALMLISLCFVLFGTFQNPWLRQFRFALQETIAPIIYVISSPIRWSKAGYHATVSFFNTYSENERLLAENKSLRAWRTVALHLAADQTRLSELLNYTPPQKSTAVTARVLSDTGNRFTKTLVVSAGRKQGVTKGDVAMTSAGVLGRIVEVGTDASRLLLLTDYASRVPVVIGSDQVFGILTGDGSLLPHVTSLPEGKTVHPRDIVLTSGQVGVYPAGLGIGVVDSVENGEIRVRLFEGDITPPFVRLVNFGTNDVLLSDTCDSGARE